MAETSGGVNAPTSFGTRRLRVALLAMAAVVALTASACGDSGSDEASSDDSATTTEADETTTTAAETTTTAPLTFDQASDNYTNCLATNGSSAEAIPEGFSLEDLSELEGSSPSSFAEMGIDPALVTAHAACFPAFQAAMDAGATPPSAPPTTVDPVLAAKMHEAVACLNARGWDFLEPGVETGPVTMAARSADFNWDDPGFLDDQYQCQKNAGMMD